MDTPTLEEQARELLFEPISVVRARSAVIFPGSRVEARGTDVTIHLADGRTVEITSEAMKTGI